MGKVTMRHSQVVWERGMSARRHNDPELDETRQWGHREVILLECRVRNKVVREAHPVTENGVAAEKFGGRQSRESLRKQIRCTVTRSGRQDAGVRLLT